MKILSFVFAAVIWIFFVCGASFPPSWDSRLGEASATERYVALNGTNDITGGYVTWSGASTNIQDAVNKCSNNDVVWVTNGTYYCWSNSATAGYTSMVTVVRASNITIQSMNGPAVTIVDANYPNFTNRCFYITSNAVVSGFTITNGNAYEAASGGGGVFIKTSGRVTNCWITGNSMTNGVSSTWTGCGGVRCDGGGEVLNCMIYANTSTGGAFGAGGIFMLHAGTFVLRDCVISNNNNNGSVNYSVYFREYTTVTMSNCTVINNPGGGIIMDQGTAFTIENCRIIGNIGLALNIGSGGITRNCQIINNVGRGVNITGGVLSNCVVSSNYYTSSGAGINMAGNSTLVTDCTIVSNYSAAGGGPGSGGVNINSGTLRNCLIANNYAKYGGALGMSVLATDTVRVENCTIVSNNSSGSGGGIFNASNTGTGVFVNVICYSNAAPSGANWIEQSAIVKLAFYNSCTTPTNNLLGINNTTNPPAFVNIAARNYRLLRSSPCINTGTNLEWMFGGFDLDGRIRIRYGTVDMGAYEATLGGTYYKFH